MRESDACRERIETDMPSESLVVRASDKPFRVASDVALTFRAHPRELWGDLRHALLRAVHGRVSKAQSADGSSRWRSGSRSELAPQNSQYGTLDAIDIERGRHRPDQFSAQSRCISAGTCPKQTICTLRSKCAASLSARRIAASIHSGSLPKAPPPSRVSSTRLLSPPLAL